jgi:hypothetical protein
MFLLNRTGEWMNLWRMKKKYNRILIVVLVILFVNTIILCDALIEVDRVDLKNYPVTLDYGTLSKKEIVVFLDILDAVEIGSDKVPYSGEVNKYRILTHLGMYYGSCEGVSKLFTWSGTTIFLNLDVFQVFQQNKVIVDARVDEAVSTLIEGSGRFKLLQIANYISERITYTDGVRQTIDGLNGEGVCATYAILFYKMATRLGIQCYLCYGFAGEYHVWNMVDLDGRQYFYDVTWYDSTIRNFQMVHSASAWGREYQINNKWWGE